MTTTHPTPLPVSPLPVNRIVRLWWPLAAGWLLLTIEVPIYTAVIARLEDPKINLAAWGVAFPLVLILATPGISLLPTSTTLCKDWGNYQTVRRYAWWTIGLMTVLHVLMAFTPLFDWVTRDLMAAPDEVIEPARLGARLMVPYAACLAYRRFNYGVLIRFGHSRAMMAGIISRLISDIVLLGAFTMVETGLPGVAIATGTMTLATTVEAIYSGIRVQPVLRHQLKPALPTEERVALRSFLAFFIPLVMTALLQIITQPIMNAALGRLPNTLESLAVFPVVFGLVSFWTSISIAYIEVVVVLLDEPHSARSLQRFAWGIGAVTMSLLGLVTVTALSDWWFIYFAALPDSLLTLAKAGLWFVLPVPLLRVWQSWYQGLLLHGKETRGITEAVVIYIVVSVSVLGLGVAFGQTTGLFVGLLAFMLASSSRTVWLWYRARPVYQARVAQRVLRANAAEDLA